MHREPGVLSEELTHQGNSSGHENHGFAPEAETKQEQFGAPKTAQFGVQSPVFHFGVLHSPLSLPLVRACWAVFFVHFTNPWGKCPPPPPHVCPISAPLGGGAGGNLNSREKRKGPQPQEHTTPLCVLPPGGLAAPRATVPARPPTPHFTRHSTAATLRVAPRTENTKLPPPPPATVSFLR